MIRFNRFNTRVLYPLAERRLNRDIRTKVAALYADAKLDRLQLEMKQRHQLQKILTHAGRHVPYYRDLFKKIDFNPDSILQDMKYFQEVPHLTKEIIQEEGERMLADIRGPLPLHVRKTGGSTGIATLIYYDQEGLDWTAAVNIYSQSFTGRTTTDTEVHLSTERTDPSPLKSKFIEQIKCLAMNRVNIFTASFSEDALEKVWQRLKLTKPFLVQGHPSTLFALAKLLERRGVPPHSLFKVFDSTGESLDEKKIAVIEHQFGCRVYNRYGTAEFGVTAHSRENPNELEILETIVYPETVSLGNGLEELVGTNLTNQTMPLIRYRSGDIGQIEFRGGRKVLTCLQGRVHDLIEINGVPHPTHYLQDILDRIGGVSEFQIVIRTSGKRELNIVLEKADRRTAILNQVKKLFAPEDIPVNFVGLENLIRIGWRDKFRYIVKEV